MALEVLSSISESRQGQAFVNAAVKKGTFMVLSGTFSAGDIAALPAGQKDKPGFAKAGSFKLLTAYDATYQSRGPAYPVTKKIFVPEDSDSSFDTIKAGAQALYFEGGRFRTSEYTDVSSAVVYGDFLKLTVSGTLTDEASLKLSTDNTVARVLALHDGLASPGDSRLEFKLTQSGV